MSPLWRDEVGIYLAPRRIALMRVGRGVRPIPQADRNITVDTREFHWESALSTLAHCLEDPTWRDANLRLVISDHWVRYATIPWSDAIADHAERIEHARISMGNTYGDVVSQWTITVSDSRPGTPLVACGIPHALLARTRALAESSGLRIRSVQPHLVAAFNGWREQLAEDGAWFVTLEEGSLAAVHFTRDEWDCVRSVRIGNDWDVELQRLQTFSRLARTSGESTRVFVDAPSGVREKCADPGADLHWLDGGTEAEEAQRLPLLRRMYA